MKTEELEQLRHVTGDIYHIFLMNHVSTQGIHSLDDLYDFAFRIALSEREGFCRNVGENQDRLFPVADDATLVNHRRRLECMLMKEILLHGNERLEVFGQTDRLVWHVLDYMEKEGLSWNDNCFETLSCYVLEECPSSVSNPLFWIYRNADEDMLLLTEYVHCSIYLQEGHVSPHILRLGKSADNLECRIAHLLLDLSLLVTSEAMESNAQALCSCTEREDVADVMSKHKTLTEKRDRLVKMIEELNKNRKR